MKIEPIRPPAPVVRKGVQRLFRRLSLPFLAVVAGLLSAVILWVVLDKIQTSVLERLYDEEVQRQQDQRASEALLRYDSYLNEYKHVVRLIAWHEWMFDWMDLESWSDEAPAEPRLTTSLGWVRREALIATSVPPRYILVYDEQGHIRAVQRDARYPFVPVQFDSIDQTYVQESRIRPVHFLLDGKPYLLIGQAVRDRVGTRSGTLLLVVPIDDRLLRVAEQSLTGDAVVALLDVDEQRILASSDPEKVPDSALVDGLRDDHVMSAHSLFDYEGSDISLLFAVLLPKASIFSARDKFVELERWQRLIGTLVFVALFSLLAYLISSRVNRSIRRIADFSQRALGISQPVAPEGNQIVLLEEWMKQMVRLFLQAREEMRRRHESEIKDTEAIKTAVLESSLDAIITLDENGVIVDFNPTAEEQFGYRSDELIGRRLAETLLEHDSHVLFDAIFECAKASDCANSSRVEMEAVDQEGRIFPVEVSIKPIELADKRLFTVYLHDISTRVRQEREIADLARFPGESPEPVLRVNSQGVVIYANRASRPLLDYWGCELSQTLPQYWRELIAQALRRGRSHEREIQHDERHYSVLLAPVMESGYVNVYARDVTAMHVAQEIARRHQTELVQVCRLSTMGEMATGIAHELNQPLSAISNYANGCIRRMKAGIGGENELIEALERIGQQSQRASEIIRRLRVMIGNNAPMRERVEVSQMLKEVVSFLEFEVKQSGVSVRLDLPAQPLYISADVVQMEQVLLNLLKNALESVAGSAVEDGWVRLSCAEESPGEVTIRVCDNGAGIEPERMQQLFDPFFTTKEEGMGMGLAISATIVQDHKGGIEVDSAPGAGAEFIIRLPAITLEIEGSLAV